jgi:hypothetical protein
LLILCKSELKSVLRSNEDSSLEDASQNVQGVLQENSLQKDGIHTAVKLSPLEKLFSQKIILILKHYHAGAPHIYPIQNDRTSHVNS